MFRNIVKRYIPEELIQIYYSFRQKRFEYLTKIPTSAQILSIGQFTYGAEHIRILFRNSGEDVKIGKFCSIASDVTILLGGEHRHDWVTTYPFGKVFQNDFGIEHFDGQTISKGSVVIGNDVWIGRGATILSGIKVGDGAVIAANSHIVTDVPPYTIVGGNPGKNIKLRFDNVTVERLLRIKWWDFSKAQINSIKMMLSQKPTETVLNELELIRYKLDLQQGVPE